MYSSLRFYFHSFPGQKKVTTSGSGYVCIIIFLSLNKMYCSQGDRRFRILLNRFWAAPPFSKVCWLALLASHHYRKLSKKTRKKVRLCLKSLEQKCLIQQVITEVEILCCHSYSMQTHVHAWSCRAGVGYHSKSWQNVGFAEHFQRKLTRNQFNCPKTPTECLQGKQR